MWQHISEIIKELSILVRIVLQDGTETEWSNWLTFPTEGYGEIKHYGPFLLREVARIEINCIETVKLGRLLPEKRIDHSESLAAAFNSKGITFEKNSNIFLISCLD